MRDGAQRGSGNPWWRRDPRCWYAVRVYTHVGQQRRQLLSTPFFVEPDGRGTLVRPLTGRPRFVGSTPRADQHRRDGSYIQFAVRTDRLVPRGRQMRSDLRRYIRYRYLLLAVVDTRSYVGGDVPCIGTHTDERRREERTLVRQAEEVQARFVGYDSSVVDGVAVVVEAQPR